MEVPLIIFMYVFLAIALVIVIFSILSVTQVVKYGLHSLPSYLMSAAYLIVVVTIIGVTMVAVRDVDWSSTLNVSLPSIGASGGST